MMKECKLVTMEDWAEAGDFDKAANPGDMVEEEIVDEFPNCLPPAKMGYGYLQVGGTVQPRVQLKASAFPSDVRHFPNAW